MIVQTPKIDKRSASEIYQQAVGLAKIYCPEWTPDEKDIGLVLLKLFSQLTEIVIRQINRVPEKHLLAFYDFIGIDHLPSAPAKVPLSFNLAEGTKEAVTVPVRTQVASAEEPTVVFETTELLTAVNFKIKSAYSLNPWKDKYTEHSSDINGSEKGFYIFDGITPILHILYISDEIFEIKDTASVDIKLIEVDPKFAKFFSRWNFCGKTIETPDIRNFPIITLNLNPSNKITINNNEGYWLSVMPSKDISITGELPTLTRIQASIGAQDIPPDICLFNDVPVDIKKGFYPFGEMPKVKDALYIGSNNVFSKKNATFKICFDVVAGTPTPNEGCTLSWEYWNGTKWSEINGLSWEYWDNERNKYVISTTDEKRKFNFDGKIRVSFTPTEEIKLTDLGGNSNRWIRVRITAGGYGKGGEYRATKSIDEILRAANIQDYDLINRLNARFTEAGITSGFKYIEPTYKPPFIKGLTISYLLTKDINTIKTYNNFEYLDIKSGEAFKPFNPPDEQVPAFYIGFAEDLKNKPVSLYFSQKSILYGEDVPKIKQSGSNKDTFREMSSFEWKYYDGINWKELAVEDGTGFFTRSGIVKFIIPADIALKMEFNKDLFWIKVEPKEDILEFELPLLKGIFPNTVWAENATVIKDEFLGSSNGEGNQVFNFSSKPLLGGQMIEIKESGVPSEDELRTIEKEEGSDALRIIKNDSGDIQEVWVKWHEVKTFVHSGSLSRHYIIDRVEGKIIFGDGVCGMIPPALPNNILTREYKSGGGKKGNQKEKTLTGLKTTIPNIDSVTNYDSSSGGRDLELIGDILTRAPHSIKNGGRAVTKEDFEWLAIEASPDVTKARCIPKDDRIQIIILPRYEGDKPVPEASLVDYVETYLKERTFAPIKDRIEVLGPNYKNINITTTIVPLLISETAIVVDRVEKILKAFLNPIKGGQNREGWDFGQSIFLSEISAIIEDVEGVDYIKNLSVNNQEITITSTISIGDNELPCVEEIIVIPTQ